jgi:hypothetical protein
MSNVAQPGVQAGRRRSASSLNFTLANKKHMECLVVTNLATYKAIAEEAYTQMVKANESSRTPRSDGAGWIIRYDPEQASFKSAMIVVVFTGMWLEALMHMLIMREHGEAKYHEYDRKSYEQKLQVLGVMDKTLLSKVERFRLTRKELVHEKAYFDQAAIKTAQKEAQIAHEVMSEIDGLFRNNG